MKGVFEFVCMMLLGVAAFYICFLSIVCVLVE